MIVYVAKQTTDRYRYGDRYKGEREKISEREERKKERESVVIITTFLYIKIRLLFKIVDFKTLGYAKYNYGEAI